jgi:hypothetical protein
MNISEETWPGKKPNAPTRILSCNSKLGAAVPLTILASVISSVLPDITAAAETTQQQLSRTHLCE